MNGPRSRALRRVLVVASAYGPLVSPQLAEACEPVDLCATWAQVPLEDAGWGDLVTEPNIPARGARITILRPYPEPAIGTFLDAEGCTSFDTQFATGHKVILYAEAVLGFGTAGQIHIKAYGSVADKDIDRDSHYFVDVPSIPEDWSLEVEAPADDEGIVLLLANATEVVHRLHELPGSLLVGGHELFIWQDAMQQNSALEFDSDGVMQGIRIGTAGGETGMGSLGKKFILAHEIGHWVQATIAVGVWGINYNYGPDVPDDPDDLLDPVAPGNPLDEPCQWAIEGDPGIGPSNPNRHGIRSAEFAPGAMPEGFGHFVAAVAYNSDLGADADGEFRYYKDPDEERLNSYIPFEEGQRVVSLLGGEAGTLGGRDRWVERRCPNDWVHPLEQETLDEEVSSEIDWLRFFWRFVTAPYAPQSSAPEFWDVVRLVTYTQEFNSWNGSDNVVWPLLRETIDDVPTLSAYDDRFEDLTDDYGVFNDGS